MSERNFSGPANQIVGAQLVYCCGILKMLAGWQVLDSQRTGADLIKVQLGNLLSSEARLYLSHWPNRRPCFSLPLCDALFTLAVWGVFPRRCLETLNPFFPTTHDYLILSLHTMGGRSLFELLFVYKTWERELTFSFFFFDWKSKYLFKNSYNYSSRITIFKYRLGCKKTP